MKTNKNWRKEIWAKSSNLCAHCGRRPQENEKTVDHVIPQILGGGNDPRNLMPLCKHCNASRASGEIIPETYYKYAAQWALEELYDYIAIWKAEHTTASGGMTVERYGIIERPPSDTPTEDDHP